MAIDIVEIQVSDLEDVRQVLAACYGFFVARDIQNAQAEFRAERPSPLRVEIERVKTRFDGYFGDFLLAEHEATLAADELADEESKEEAEEGSGELTEALSGTPLGDFTAPKQKGKRVTAKDKSD